MAENGKFVNDLVRKGVPGAIGGAIAWVISLTPQGEYLVVVIWPTVWYISLPMFVVLGAVAALAFLEVVISLNQANLTAVVVIALVAGMFWEPVIGRIVSVETATRRMQETTNQVGAVLNAVDVALTEEESTEEDKEAYSQRADAAAISLVDTTLDVTRGKNEIPPSILGLVAEVGSRGSPGTQREIIHRLLDQGLADTSALLERETEESRLNFLDVPTYLPTSTETDTLWVDSETAALSVEETEETEVIHRFEVSQAANYRLEISNPGGTNADLVAAVFGTDRNILAVDDDGGQGLAPCITVPLEAGTHYLRVTGYWFDEPVPEFVASLVRDGECDDT